MLNNALLLLGGGLISGLLAGLLGIGGGTVLVPLLLTLHYSPLQSVATSSLAIALTSISGTVQNWRMGYLDFQRVFSLGIPALLTAQLGVYWANRFSSSVLLYAFGGLLVLNIFLVELRKYLEKKLQNQSNRENSDVEISENSSPKVSSNGLNSLLIRLITGGAAGILAGLFGVGGGVIMVPLQMLLLQEPIKTAIQTSLGVIVMTAIAAVVGHGMAGNVVYGAGILVGIGGLIGAQISTRYLPKLPDSVVSLSFKVLLALLSIYTFWQASQANA